MPPRTPPTIAPVWDEEVVELLLEDAVEVTTEPAERILCVSITVMKTSPFESVEVTVACTEVVMAALSVLLIVDEGPVTLKELTMELELAVFVDDAPVEAFDKEEDEEPEPVFGFVTPAADVVSALEVLAEVVAIPKSLVDATEGLDVEDVVVVEIDWVGLDDDIEPITNAGQCVMIQ